MNVLWIAAGVIVTVATVDGIRHGVVRRAVELVGLVLVFLFASRLADLLTPHLDGRFGLSSRAAFYSAWAVVLIGGVIGVRLAASGLRKVVHLTIAGWLDRAGGAVLGLTFGLLLSSCLFILVHALPVSGDLRNELEESPEAAMMLHLAPAVYDAGTGLVGGQGFFDMVREHIEPAAARLRDEAEGISDRAADVAH
jgi:uncharacterized membrane protein required for colicin V production